MEKNNQLKIMDTDTSIQKVETSPFALLTMAVSQNLDVEKLEKLMQLQERWEANNARKLFLQAMSNFQFTCPKITKKRKVSFKDVRYSFAGLDEIAETIKQGLKDNDLSYRWELKDIDNTIVCSCIVSHVAGHSETTNVSAGKDSTGSKNEIQARGSAISYLQRYSLISALGITTADTDTDGVPPAKKEDFTPAHPKWKEAITSIKANKTTVEAIAKYYILTPENETKLRNELITK